MVVPPHAPHPGRDGAAGAHGTRIAGHSVRGGRIHRSVPHDGDAGGAGTRRPFTDHMAPDAFAPRLPAKHALYRPPRRGEAAGPQGPAGGAEARPPFTEDMTFNALEAPER